MRRRDLVVALKAEEGPFRPLPCVLEGRIEP